MEWLGSLHDLIHYILCSTSNKLILKMSLKALINYIPLGLFAILFGGHKTIQSLWHTIIQVLFSHFCYKNKELIENVLNQMWNNSGSKHKRESNCILSTNGNLYILFLCYHRKHVCLFKLSLCSPVWKYWLSRTNNPLATSIAGASFTFQGHKRESWL